MKPSVVVSTVSFSLILIIQGCSSSSNLRKFKDEDLQKEIPADIAKRFEVKDATPTPTPESVVVTQPTRSKKKKAPKKEPKVTKQVLVPPVRTIDPMPFEVGEKLAYGIRFIGVTAGYFNTEVLPMKTVDDRKVYHLHGAAKTVKLFELVYRVNDQIDSFWDAEGLYSHKFTMDLDESKQTRKVIELYDYDNKKSFYWNRVDHVEKGFKEQKEQYDIALWSQDPLSSLYYFRVLALPKEVGKETRFPLVLDGKPWESVVRYLGREKIYAGGRDFEADAYQLENYQNGELKNKDNKVWLSADVHRYVLRIEAKLKVGSFAVALDKIL